MRIHERLERGFIPPLHMSARGALIRVVKGARSSLLLALGLAVAACGAARHRPAAQAEILLYDGPGTSPGDVAAIEALLADNRLAFMRANSAELDAMPPMALTRFRLIIVPGGDFVSMARNMSGPTAAGIRSAVRSGVSYLGICAGGFLAGRVYDNGLDLTGVKFGFYSAEGRGIRKAAVPIATAGGPTLEQYWEDGPQFTGWGAVIARYPDRTPAIVEGRAGRGRVILTGIHGEAPESWRAGMRFATPVRVDNDYAARLIRAALADQPLAHY